MGQSPVNNNNAFIPSISAEQYEAIDRLRTSDLVSVILDPEKYHFIKKYNLESGQTSSMSKGTKIHMAILEPEKFASLEVVSTKTTTKANCIGAEEKQICTIIADILRKNEFFRKLLDSPKCAKEAALLWSIGGLDIKSKIDILSFNKKGTKAIIIDIKTIAPMFGSTATDAKMGERVIELGYDIQAQGYAMAVLQNFPKVKEVEYKILFVNSSPPFKPSLMKIGSFKRLGQVQQETIDIIVNMHADANRDRDGDNDELPKVSDIAKLRGVHRTTILETLQSLEKKGCLKIVKQGKSRRVQLSGSAHDLNFNALHRAAKLISQEQSFLESVTHWNELEFTDLLSQAPWLQNKIEHRTNPLFSY